MCNFLAAKNTALRDVSVLLVESSPEKNWDAELRKEAGSFSNRVSSLNENTKTLLQNVDIWEALKSISCHGVSQIKVLSLFIIDIKFWA